MNWYYLAPELSLGILALAIILLDLVIPKKSWLAGISLVGLLVPLAFNIAFWGTRDTAFGGALIIDNFALFFKFLFLGVAALVILASIDYVKRFSAYQGEYYALVLLTTGAMMLMAATGELISIYISLETTSIGLYVLAGFLRDRKSSEAGLKYLVLGAVSSAVLLYGLAFLFGLTGTTDLRAIAAQMPVVRAANPLTLSAAIVFITAGFGFKIAAIPFQMWVPDVYEGAPTPITAFLSVASKAAGFAIVLRVFYLAFGDPSISVDWAALFAVLAAFSMTVGNVVAILQTNIKRLLAYSSIAQAGYVMVGLAAVSSLDPARILGPSGVAFYLLGYAFTNLGAFIAVIAISNRINSDLISDYAGMFRRAPLLVLAFTLCLVSLTGIPPTVGFIAKIYIFNAAVQNDLVWLVVVAVVNSAISAYYYLDVVRTMYMGTAPSTEAVPSSPAISAALFCAVAGVLIVGLIPSPFLQLAQTAVASLAR